MTFPRNLSDGLAGCIDEFHAEIIRQSILRIQPLRGVASSRHQCHLIDLRHRRPAQLHRMLCSLHGHCPRMNAGISSRAALVIDGNVRQGGKCRLKGGNFRLNLLEPGGKGLGESIVPSLIFRSTRPDHRG